LLAKMDKKAGAIGFAVYLDLLAQLSREKKSFDVDVVLTYDVATDMGALVCAAEGLRKEGKSVLIRRCGAIGVRYRMRMQLGKGGLEILETND